MRGTRGIPTRTNPVISIFKDMFMYGLEIFGRYYSNYRGFVYDVNDVDGMGRIKLIIPEVGGDTPYEYWAHPIGVFSGKGYGVQVLPQKGDLVWVSFEGGHPEVPCWQHGYFGNSEPPQDTDLKDPNCYWFKSPQGHLIKINDTKSYIHIQHKGGQTILIDDSAISLISSKAISLGTKDTSAQPALLGNDVKQTLSDINGFLNDLANALFADGPTLTPYAPVTVGFTPILQAKVKTITADIQKILSTKTTLD